MKHITIAQINPIINDFEINTKKITKVISDHINTDLFIFPELSFSGYMPYDYLDYPHLQKLQKNAIETVSNTLQNTQCAIVGGIRYDTNALYNTAYMITPDKIQSVRDKRALPSYDVFFEKRYFTPEISASTISTKTIFTIHTICNMRIATAICYDLWNEQFIQENFSKLDKTIDCIVWISASPYTTSKSEHRVRLAQYAVTHIGSPLCMVNMTGANEELVFDGQSFVMNMHGEIVHMCALCNEEIHTVSFSSNSKTVQNTVSPTQCSSPARFLSDKAIVKTGTVCAKLSYEKSLEIMTVLACGLIDYMHKSSMPIRVHIGLSGGIDSAVTACLAVQALGNEAVTGILLPSRYTNKTSLQDAHEVAHALQIKTHTLSIESIFSSIQNSFAPIRIPTKPELTEENIQARIRGLLLMAYSNEHDSLLLTTGNKSEIATGYCTLYGDMCGSLNLIGDLYKTEVYDIAHAINTYAQRDIIPQTIINKPPTAELRNNQKDSDSLPEYDVLDAILYKFIERKQSVKEVCDTTDYDQSTIQRVWKLLISSEYKRYQAAPIIKISDTAFGRGRIMPIVARMT